jgi:hypothetical protein
MKKIIVILFLLITAVANAQIEKVKKLVWHNEALQAVVASSKNLHYISFTKDDNSYLEIRPDTSRVDNKRLVYDNSYSTVYLGHIYLFEKQFGTFPAAILLKKLDSLRRNDCYTNNYEGRIFAGHIDIKVSSTCPGKSTSEDRVFYKVEDKPGFLGGPAAFQQFVQDRLACTNYRSYLQNDSAFFFYAVTKSDSMCHDVKPIDSIQSPLRTIIQNALINTHGWKPYVKDGRNMNAYMQVFIRLRKDGHIEADYRR